MNISDFIPEFLRKGLGEPRNIALVFFCLLLVETSALYWLRDIQGEQNKLADKHKNEADQLSRKLDTLESQKEKCEVKNQILTNKADSLQKELDLRSQRLDYVPSLSLRGRHELQSGLKNLDELRTKLQNYLELQKNEEKDHLLREITRAQFENKEIRAELEELRNRTKPSYKPEAVVSGTDFGSRLFTPNTVEKILRGHPNEGLSINDVKSMLRANNFYHRDYNANGKGINNKFDHKIAHSKSIVIDYATLLMWQQSGSGQFLTMIEAVNPVLSG